MESQKTLNLAPVTQCPVCGSTKRVVLSSSVMNAKPDSYTQRFAEFLGTTHSDLLNGSQQIECGDCGAVFLDPWLSKGSQTTLFQLASPTHISGWTEWEVATRTGVGRPHMIALAELLEKTLGRPKHYVEIACPFSGLLLATAPAQGVAQWRAKSSPSSRPDWRMTKMARIYSVWDRLGLRVTDAILAIRRRLARAPRPTATAGGMFSGARTFAVVPSLRRWSLGCNRFGTGCSQVALQALTCDVAMLDELAPNSANLVGIFNSLDHVEDPVAVLRKCLEIAPHVVVAGHEPSRAKYQHAYAFDANTIRRLGEKHAFTVTDLVDQMSDWPRLEYLVLLNRA